MANLGFLNFLSGATQGYASAQQQQQQIQDNQNQQYLQMLGQGAQSKNSLLSSDHKNLADGISDILNSGSGLTPDQIQQRILALAKIYGVNPEDAMSIFHELTNAPQQPNHVSAPEQHTARDHHSQQQITPSPLLPPPPGLAHPVNDPYFSIDPIELAPSTGPWSDYEDDFNPTGGQPDYSQASHASLIYGGGH